MKKTQLHISCLFLAGALLVFLPFLRVLSDSNAAFLFRDVSNVWLPYKATWLAAVGELGRIPHWDSRHVGGFPMFADPNCGPLYPLNWLLIPLSRGSPARGLTFFLVLHHLLIYAGWFFLLRDRRARPLLCVAGGIAAAWMGPAMSADNLLHVLCGQASVGFFLLFWRRALRSARGGLALFGASAALAWPVYGGDPQYAYLLAAIAAGMALAAAHARRLNLAEAIRRTGFLAGLTCLAAAPQLLPTAHYLASVGRMLDTLTEAEHLAYSVHPLRTPELLFPLVFGDDPSPAVFRGAFLVNGGPMPFLFSLYVGTFAALFSLAQLCRRPPLSRRLRGRDLRRALAFAGFLALVLLVWGAYSPVPLYSLALRSVPLWRSFRFPDRLGYWLGACLLLAGFRGAETAMRSPPLRSLEAAAVLLALAGGAYAYWLWGIGLSPMPVARTLAFTLALVGAIRLPARGWRAPLLTLLCLADLAPVALRLAWQAPVALTRPQSFPWAGKILADLSRASEPARAGRFFSAIEARLRPPGGIATDELPAFAYSAWAGMKFNTPSTWGLRIVRGHAAMVPEPPVLAIASRSGELSQRALDLYSTRYILAVEHGVPQAAVRTSALPEVSFPPRAEPFGSVDALVARLASAEWNPRASVLVEAGVAAVGAPTGGGEVVAFTRSWDNLSVRARVGADASERWLLVNESYDSQWAARLGGKNLEIARANGWAMAVRLPPLPAGEFTVEFEFRDRWFQAGLVLAAFWGCGALAFWLRRRFPTLLRGA